MKINDSVVFVTGANRGLGLEFARQALALGARKVYAAARDPSQVKLAGVTPIKLDVTNLAEVAAAAKECGDVTLFINNAGIGRPGSVSGPDALPLLRDLMETNLFGVANTSQAFAGVLARNGGGAILNVLSILSWIGSPLIGGYAVTKAAAWSLTNSLRIELRPQGTQVVGLHAGYIDTDLIRAFDVPKSRPEDVVRQAYEAIEAGEEEVRVDEATRQVKQGLSSGVYLADVTSG